MPVAHIFTKCFYFIFFRKDTVKISMDTFVKRFQPDKYHKWINGNDIGPHPEDNKKKRYGKWPKWACNCFQSPQNEIIFFHLFLTVNCLVQESRQTNAMEIKVIAVVRIYSKGNFINFLPFGETHKNVLTFPFVSIFAGKK